MRGIYIASKLPSINVVIGAYAKATMNTAYHMTKTKEIKISHEHSGYTWMDYNSAMEKTTFDNAKTVLTKAQKLLSDTL